MIYISRIRKGEKGREKKMKICVQEQHDMQKLIYRPLTMSQNKTCITSYELSLLKVADLISCFTGLPVSCLYLILTPLFRRFCNCLWFLGHFAVVTAAFSERGSPAGHGRRQVRGLHISGHYHQNLLLKRHRRLHGVSTRSVSCLGITGGGVVFTLQVARELPVGAGEDQECKSYETQHGRQAPEEVRHRRVPGRVRLHRRGRRCRRCVQSPSCSRHTSLLLLLPNED